jgi:hypothetical protein
MEMDDVKGVAILSGFLAFGAFILGGMMERKLARINNVVKQIEEDSKYVN